MTAENKKSEGVPSKNSNESAVNPQVWIVVFYDSKTLYICTKQRIKKRHDPTKQDYCLELETASTTEFTYVVDEEFPQLPKASGVRIVIVDNDRKAPKSCGTLGKVWNNSLAGHRETTRV